MNYYPHHIGDYVTATAHLSMTEDGAYRRLLDLYYSRESSIPADRKSVHKLARAQSKADRAAIDRVLDEFFRLQDGGWHQSRCDFEIERYLACKGAHWSAGLTKAERAAIQAVRRAQKMRATPKWLTAAHLARIKAIYAESAQLSAETGIKHHVDHIVPLRGKTVCGLHVPWNLLPIPADENINKGNALL